MSSGLLDEQARVVSPIDDALSVTLNVGIVGLGYVGLPTAISLASQGHRVTGLDVSEERLAAIRAFDVDLLPSDLELLKDCDTLDLTSEPSDLKGCDTVIIAVPTPVDRNLVPDLRAIQSACATVVEHARAEQLIILTSTTYAGSTRDMLTEPLTQRGFTVGEDIFVAFSPERIDPANLDVHHNQVPRVVGGVTKECTQRAKGVLAQITPSVHVVSSPEVAEMCKLLENTFRAVNISLANEFAEIAQTLGLDPMEIIGAAATKPYGFMPFYPGPGVGGHCIPCDPRYLQWQMRPTGTPTPVIDASMTAMAARPGTIVRRAMETLSDHGKGLRGAKVLVAGIAYKPNVQDVRESPALEILDMLREKGAEVTYFDPWVESVRLGDGETMRTEDHFRPEDADLVLVHTLHRDLDVEALKAAPVVLDATYRLDALDNRVLP
jgi:UDP-N-acetyl-D-glucosamine dehydrogenase